MAPKKKEATAKPSPKSTSANSGPQKPTTEPPPAPVAGRFAYDGLHRVFHEKARLGIMTSLLSYPRGLTFSELKELCSLSDGNLNRHLDVLREEGFVDVDKSGAGRAAKTVCSATVSGKRNFFAYLDELQRVVEDASKLSDARSIGSPAPRMRTT